MPSISGAACRVAGIPALVLFLAVLPGCLTAQQEGLVIRQLSFKGNSALDDLTLQSAIETTNSSTFARLPLIRGIGLGTKRHLRDRALERDVERIRLLYRIGGYLEVAVDTLIRRTERDAYIVFQITEGAPVRLARLTITGLDDHPDHASLTADLPIEVGDPFDRNRIGATMDTITSRLHERGYALAQAAFGERSVDSAAYRAEATIEITPGPVMHIGSIAMESGNAADSTFIQGFLATETGRVYRQSDLVNSQRNLALSGVYRFVSVEVDTAAFDAQSGQVPLIVRVVPGPRQRVGGSIGYGTEDCFRGSLSWTGRNVFGQGRILDLDARVSKIGVGRPTDWGLEDRFLCGLLKEDPIGSDRLNYSVSATISRGAFLAPGNRIALSLFAELGSEFAVYSREQIGGSVTFSRELRPGLPLSVGYRITYGATDASDANFCAYFNICTIEDQARFRERQRQGVLTASITRLRVNSLLDPSRGSSIGVTAEYSSGLTASEEFQRFTRITGDWATYHPIRRSLVFATRLRAGAVFAPEVALESGDETTYIPPDHRFYAGGPNDVRGYDGNRLGPVAYVLFGTESELGDSIPGDRVTVSPIGGSRVLVGNVELRFPSPVFPSFTRLAAFVDAGTVWDNRPERSAPFRLRATPGMGVRFATPLGPARLDLAYNAYDFPPGDLYRENPDGSLTLIQGGYVKPGGKGVTVHFAIGQAF